MLIFLVIGALAGPSVLDFVNPEEIGEIFPVTLEVLVAIIVFEGALFRSTWRTCAASARLYATC